MRFLVFLFLNLLAFTLAACVSEPIEGSPDLAIYGSRNGYRPPCIGSETIMAIDFTVVNKGDAVAPPFDVSVSGTQVPIGDELEPNDSIRILYPASADILNNSPYIVAVDPNNEIIELDESNNEVAAYTMTLTAPAPCPIATTQP
jgi:CARDB